RLLEVASGGERGMIATGELANRELVTTLAFAPGGLVLATGDFGPNRKHPHRATLSVRLWNRATGKLLRRLTGPRSRIRCVVFSPDGRLLVSAGWDNTCLVWDVADLLVNQSSPPAPLKQAQLVKLWEDLAGEDATKGYQAIGNLIRARRQAVPFLADRLGKVPPIDARQIRGWVADLDSDEFLVRSRAARNLEQAGGAAEPALRKVLQGRPSAEVGLVAEDLLAKLSKQPLAPRLVRQLRAVEVLEHAGTPEAQKVLDKLAKRALDARLEQEVKASLERLSNNPVRRP